MQDCYHEWDMGIGNFEGQDLGNKLKHQES